MCLHNYQPEDECSQRGEHENSLGAMEHWIAANHLRLDPHPRKNSQYGLVPSTLLRSQVAVIL